MRRAEAALRDGYSAVARLAIAAARVQEDRELPVVFGHQVYGQIGKANVSVGDAITNLATVHRLVTLLAEQLGIDSTAYGPEGPKPGSGAGFFTHAEDATPAIAG